MAITDKDVQTIKPYVLEWIGNSVARAGASGSGSSVQGLSKQEALTLFYTKSEINSWRGNHTADENIHHTRLHSITATDDHSYPVLANVALGMGTTAGLPQWWTVEDIHYTASVGTGGIVRSSATGSVAFETLTTGTSVTTPAIYAASNLNINAVGYVHTLDVVRSTDYDPGLVGTMINFGTGEIDTQKIEAVELYVDAFIAKVKYAWAQGAWWGKSASETTRDFDIPTQGSSATLYVAELPGLSGFDVFAAGDYLRLPFMHFGTATAQSAYTPGYTTDVVVDVPATPSVVTISKGSLINGCILLAQVDFDNDDTLIVPSGWSLEYSTTGTASRTDTATRFYSYRIDESSPASWAWTITSPTGDLVVQVVAVYNAKDVAWIGMADDTTTPTVTVNASVPCLLVAIGISDWGPTEQSASINGMTALRNEIHTETSPDLVCHISIEQELIGFVGEVKTVTGWATADAWVMGYFVVESLDEGYGSAAIGQAHGIVSRRYDLDLNPGEQAYTWTTTNTSSGQGLTALAGSPVVDIGQSGQGIVEVSTVGSNRPWIRTATWSGANPLQGTWTTTAMMGNVAGLTGSGTPEYGFWAGYGTAYLALTHTQALLSDIPLVMKTAGTEFLSITPTYGVILTPGSTQTGYVGLRAYSFNHSVLGDFGGLSGYVASSRANMILRSRTTTSGYGANLYLESETTDTTKSALNNISATNGAYTLSYSGTAGASSVLLNLIAEKNSLSTDARLVLSATASQASASLEGEAVTLSVDDELILIGIPTSAPASPGRVYRSGNALMIST